MSDISSRLAALSPEKRRILALALQKQGGGRDTFPLSFAQQRLWFLDQWQPGSAAYNSPMALRLAGRLDADALGRALSEIVERHEALRTVYLGLEGRPVQTVQPAAPVPLPVDDLAALPEPARAAEARRLIDAETGTPFDLARGPLLRARLLRLGAEEHVLVVVTHHIAFDGSVGIFFRELTTLYDAFARGWASPLPQLPIQYADFAVWQRDRLQGELLDAQLAWWRERLAGAPPALQLPVARPVPRVRTDRGEGFRFAFPRELSERVRTLARAEGATVFMALLAAWDALLHRYTGESDLLVGTPIQVRTRAETEGLIGCFTNTVVVRASAEANPTFRELLRRVRDAALGAFAHGEVPFERLVDELHPERDPGQNPLFQVMFVVHPGATAGELRMGEVAVSPVPTDTGRSRLSILLGMTDADDGLTGVLEYSMDLFDHAAVERMVGHFRALLEAAVAEPETRLLDLPLLSEMEARRVVHEWNATDGDYPRGVCMHQLFEAQARRTPDALAVTCGERTLTYAEVEREANRLAHRLRGLGVGPGVYVGVHLERSEEMVPALLGILKAGGVYVPVEIGHPPARMAAVLGSLEAAVVVTQTAHAGVLAGLAPELPSLRELVCVDRGGSVGHPVDGVRVWAREETDALPDTPVDSGVGADDLAYVIFTSGSTGAPKGVMVRHAPAVNLIDWVNRTFGVGPADRVLFVTSLSFDLSVYDVFGLLAAGGSVRVATADETRDPERLVRILAEEPVTFWDSAPAALQQLVPFFGPEEPAALRLVFLSGDWIPVALPDQVRRRFHGAEVVSLGGATEATVWSNFHRVGVVDPDWTSIPYGRPMRNARYYVLDEQMQPAPTGVAGDLFIGGEVLAEGYAAAPELTATKFVPDPFGGRPGARIYRTGDRARFWWDGTMEFLGRLDAQVKVRGFRIELGEIETALCGHPALRDVVVAAREDEPRVKRLVAYVVPDAGAAAPGAADLRAYLRERLPEYMVPSAFVALDALPVTPNGKLDRRALPAPQQDRPREEHGFEAPRTDAERTLAAIWAETLRVERVGIHDNFFELGGDSILSIQVVARAAAAGMKISPQLVFRNQTVAELALAAQAAEAPRAEDASTAGEVPATPVQRWFFAQELPEPAHWNQSLVLEATGPVDPVALERALAAVLAQHDSLRLRFRRTADGWTQAYAAEGVFPLDRVDLSDVADAEVAAALREHGAATQAGMELEHGPLARAALFDLGPERPARLLLAVHHLVVDGVSWRPLLEDLETAYRKLTRHEPLSLPAKTASYRSWAERLAEHARGGAPLAEAALWREIVAPGAAELPVDFAGGANPEGSARTVTTTLGADETRALLTEVARAYHTRADETLLAALALAVGGWTGGGPLLLDLESHGREELFDGVDLSRTVGWFTSIHPARLEVAPEADPGAALKAVKEQLRRIPRQGIGWGLLRWAAPDAEVARALAEAPRPRLAFNYLGQFDAGRSADAFFRITPETAGPARGAANPRTHLLEVNAAVADGELRVGWTYGAEVHREETVRALADRFLDALRGILAHCRTADAGGYTPSDFPSAKLNQKSLDRLMGKLAKAGA